MNPNNPGKRPPSPATNAKKRPDRRDLTKLEPWKHKPEGERNYQAFFSIPADLDIRIYVGQELEALDWMVNREEMNLWMETNVSNQSTFFFIFELFDPSYSLQ